MRSRLTLRFIHDRSGIAATEFALLAPFFIVLIFSSFTIFGAVRANYVADRATFTIGDLISRQTETSNQQLAQMEAVFEYLAIDLDTEPQLRMTSLIRSADGFVTDWSYASNQGGTLAATKLPLDQLPETSLGDSILLTESIVTVNPFLNILPAAVGSTLTFSHSATTRPRFVGRLTKLN